GQTVADHPRMHFAERQNVVESGNGGESICGQEDHKGGCPEHANADHGRHSLLDGRLDAAESGRAISMREKTRGGPEAPRRAPHRSFSISQPLYAPQPESITGSMGNTQ